MFNDDWMRERVFLDEEITKSEDLIRTRPCLDLGDGRHHIVTKYDVIGAIK